MRPAGVLVMSTGIIRSASASVLDVETVLFKHTVIEAGQRNSPKHFLGFEPTTSRFDDQLTSSRRSCHTRNSLKMVY